MHWFKSMEDVLEDPVASKLLNQYEPLVKRNVCTQASDIFARMDWLYFFPVQEKVCHFYQK